MVTNPVDMIQDEHDDVSGAKRILMYGLTTGGDTTPVLLEDNGTMGYLKLDGSNANTNIDIGVYDLTSTGTGTFGYNVINQTADDQGLLINGYDDMSGANIGLYMTSSLNQLNSSASLCTFR